MFQAFDIEHFSSLKSLEEICGFLWNHYLSRKRKDEYEPFWIIKPYSLAKKYLDNKSSFSEDDYFILNQLIKSHLSKDGSEVPVRTGFPNEGSRIMHDSWKAGSFTWIFMGRSFTDDISFYKGFVVLSRTLPKELFDSLDTDAPQTLFAAYDKSNELKNIGPAIYLDDLFFEIDKETINV